MGEEDPKSVSLDFRFAKKNLVLCEPQGEAHLHVVYTHQTRPEILVEVQRAYHSHLLSFETVSEQDFNQRLNVSFESQKDAYSFSEDWSDEDIQHVLEDMPDNEDLLEAQESAPIIRLLNSLLSKAIQMGSSDIHFEVFKNEFLVRFRIDGVLHEVHQLPKNISVLLISRIKVMAKLDIAEKKTPQDGRINIKIAGREVDIRVSVLPSSHGERAVLRILDKRQAKLDLEHLGAHPEVIATLNQLISEPHGIVLVTGPTGSGKTTTLYAAINKLNSMERNILTVEDPIEYDLTGIGQTQVNTKVGMTFAKGLRAILRQDPDVIMVGEIRDKETANISIEASLTGHLVFSTLHTNNAVGAIIRLRDMGVQSFLLSSSLLGVCAQRLVRRLCDECKQSYTPDAAQRKWLGSYQGPLYRPHGCEACNQLGYKGRVGIYEIIVLDENLKKMIHDEASENSIKEYAKRHFDDIRMDGIKRVISGETSLEEVLRVTQVTGTLEDMSDGTV